MQRVYLLLRNNRESGPHSADELEKMGLKPFDLIWVDGISQAWVYPSEVAALKRLVPPMPAQPEINSFKEEIQATPPQPTPVPVKKNTHPHIFVSLPQGKRPTAPVDDIEARAEALRRKMETTIPASEPLPTTHYQRSMDEVSEEYGSWLLQAKTKRKKRFSARHLAGGVVVMIGLAAGWWIGRIAYSSPSLTLAQQSAQEAKKETKKPVKKVQAPVYKQKEEILPAIQTDSVINEADLTALTEKPKTIPEKKVKGQPAVKSLPLLARDSEKVTSIQVADEPKPVEIKEPVVQAPPVADEPKKKKGLFASLFGKKDKENSNEAKKAVDISDKITLRLKEDSEAWMMGVQGAKLVLRNESSLELKQAAIEISYFNDQNSVLDKKTVAVGGVGSGKSKTVSIPDHRIASRVSYQLLSATGEE